MGEKNMAATNKKDYSDPGKGILGLNKQNASEETKQNTNAPATIPFEDKKLEQSDLSPLQDKNQNIPETAVYMPATIATENSGTSNEVERKKPGRRKSKEEKVVTTVELSMVNFQFVEDIRTIEGISLRQVINNILDDLRVEKREALDKALEIHRQGKKMWKNL